LVRDRLEPCFIIDLTLLEALHDQLRNALCVVDGRIPRRELRAAAEAWAEAGMLGLLRRVEEAAVRRLGRLHATDGPAVDAGGRDADEEDAVKPRVTGRKRVIEAPVVRGHFPTIRRGRAIR
jgi:hypothetical protein